jgi:hypothetical protein
MKNLVIILFILIYSFYGCQKGTEPRLSFGKEFPKSTPQSLSYENIAILLNDMQIFSGALKKLDEDILKKANDRYVDVYFETEQPPLVMNVTPVAGGVTFLILVKDPDTGSNYMLKYDRKLPVIDSDSLELQIRKKDEKAPVSCLMPVPDPAAYLNEYKSHEMKVKFTLYKKFLQSGTYDFDALKYPGYRTRGYAFIVFDLVKADLADKTTGQTCSCRLEG